jgi:hypothetical protein
MKDMEYCAGPPWKVMLTMGYWTWRAATGAWGIAATFDTRPRAAVRAMVYFIAGRWLELAEMLRLMLRCGAGSDWPQSIIILPAVVQTFIPFPSINSSGLSRTFASFIEKMDHGNRRDCA